MKILHTSDWHIGRTFHQHSTAEALGHVLDSLVEVVRQHGVDVVVVSGDIFDSATPSAPAVQELDRVLVALSRAGARVVATSGNHDSPARLGAKAAFTAEVGVHIRTRAEEHAQPVVITDEHGPVHFYAIPYLEPSLVRQHWPQRRLSNQAEVMEFAMDNVRDDLQSCGSPRSVVLAHTFVAGAEGASCDSERAITAGGIDRVPVPTFDGVTYAALGHIHRRNTLADHVRYSGAPLHLSFSEQDAPRGAWLVTLDGEGLHEVRWMDLPVPRRLTTLTGTLADLLHDPQFDAHVDDWVRVRLSDSHRPLEPMRRLRERFSHCAVLEFAPTDPDRAGGAISSEALAVLSDEELMSMFLAHVRGGEGPSADEAALLADVVSHVRAAEAGQ